jgi:hypothetical protein
LAADATVRTRKMSTADWRCLIAIVVCAILASDGGPQLVMAFIIGGLGVILGYGLGRQHGK